MLIGEGIINGFAFPAKADQFGVLEHAELVRDGGLGQPKQLCYVTNAHFRFKQGVKNFNPGRIPKYFEQLGQIIEGFVCRQVVFHLLDHFSMYACLFTARNRFSLLHEIPPFINI